MTDFVVHFTLVFGLFAVVGSYGNGQPTFDSLCVGALCGFCVATLIHIGFGERGKRDEIDGFFGG